MKKKRTVSRKVKAWVVVNYKTGKIIFSELLKPNSAIYVGSGQVLMGKDALILPCTIEFSLPPKPVKRKK